MFRQKTNFNLALNNLKDSDIVYGHTTERKKLINDITSKYFIDIYNHAFIEIATDSYPIPKFMQLIILKFCIFECPKQLTTLAYNFDSFCYRFEGEKTRTKDYFQYTLTKAYGGLFPMVKKRCKLGMLWTLSNGGSIHFIIDSIDLAACFNSHENRYTYSELRFVYRNWQSFKKYNAKERFNFFKTINGKLSLVDAPWEADPTIVIGYKPKNSRANIYASFFNQLDINDQKLINEKSEIVFSNKSSSNK